MLGTRRATAARATANFSSGPERESYSTHTSVGAARPPSCALPTTGGSRLDQSDSPLAASPPPDEPWRFSRGRPISCLRTTDVFDRHDADRRGGCHRPTAGVRRGRAGLSLCSARLRRAHERFGDEALARIQLGAREGARSDSSKSRPCGCRGPDRFRPPGRGAAHGRIGDVAAVRVGLDLHAELDALLRDRRTLRSRSDPEQREGRCQVLGMIERRCRR